MSREEFFWKNASGLKIFAQEWRPEGALLGVVTLVHGLGEHIGRYEHVAQALNCAGFGLLGFDNTGHGRSEGVRGHGSFAGSVNDLSHALEESARRYPGRPRFLYGHSMGGALALYYLLKEKPALNGAIVTSPGLATGEQVPPSKLLLAKVMARLMPSFTLENGLDLTNLSHDAAVIQAYKDDPLVHPRISARLGLDLLTLGSWIQEHAPELPVPLLLMQGSKDHIVSPSATEAFAKASPPDKITYRVWEGLYHETHNEPEQQQVLGTMVDWINQHC